MGPWGIITVTLVVGVDIIETLKPSHIPLSDLLRVSRRDNGSNSTDCGAEHGLFGAGIRHVGQDC